MTPVKPSRTGCPVSPRFKEGTEKEEEEEEGPLLLVVADGGRDDDRRLLRETRNAPSTLRPVRKSKPSPPPTPHPAHFGLQRLFCFDDQPVRTVISRAVLHTRQKLFFFYAPNETKMANTHLDDLGTR